MSLCEVALICYFRRLNRNTSRWLPGALHLQAGEAVKTFLSKTPRDESVFFARKESAANHKADPVGAALPLNDPLLR